LKTFVVQNNDGWNPPRFISAKSPRQACKIFLEKFLGKTNPKLSRMMMDSKDGTFHIGYVNGRNWMTVGQYIPLEVKE
jgi:hypothetical protein